MCNFYNSSYISYLTPQFANLRSTESLSILILLPKMSEQKKSMTKLLF